MSDLFVLIQNEERLLCITMLCLTFFVTGFLRGQRPIGGNQDWQHFPATGAPPPAFNLPTPACPAPCPQRRGRGKVLRTQAQVWTIPMNPNVTSPPYVEIYPTLYSNSTVTNDNVTVTSFHNYLRPVEIPPFRLRNL